MPFFGLSPRHGLHDRAPGIACLNGLWEAIDKNTERLIRMKLTLSGIKDAAA